MKPSADEPKAPGHEVETTTLSAAHFPPDGAPYATLEGPMAYLDQESLPNTAESWKVAPGCHVLVSRDRIYLSSGLMQGWIVNAARAFGLMFRADHRYVIQATSWEADGQHEEDSVKLQVQVQELDPHGALVATHRPMGWAAARAYCGSSSTP